VKCEQQKAAPFEGGFLGIGCGSPQPPIPNKDHLATARQEETVKMRFSDAPIIAPNQ
jgi:hypothetical protein